MEKKVLSPWGHFDGQGVSDSVPPYLRSANRVQNLFLSCWDAVSFVREISEAKCGTSRMTSEQLLTSVTISSGLRHKDLVEPDKAPFAEYFEVFLKVILLGSLKSITFDDMWTVLIFFLFSLQERFKTPQRVVEVSYNLIDALKKYSFDSDCRIFLAVLDGKISEEIWDDQRLMLREIMVRYLRSLVRLNTASKYDNLLADSGRLGLLRCRPDC